MTGFSGTNRKGYRALIRVSDEPIKVNLHYSDNCSHVFCFHFILFSSLVSFQKEHYTRHVILIALGKIKEESVCQGQFMIMLFNPHWRSVVVVVVNLRPYSEMAYMHTSESSP